MLYIKLKKTIRIKFLFIIRFLLGVNGFNRGDMMPAIRKNKKLSLEKALKIIFLVLLLIISANMLINFFLFENQDGVKELAFENGLSYRSLGVEEKGFYEFETEIKKDELISLPGEEYNLIISRLTAVSYQVYLNDVLIGSLGDLEKQRSNIWNDVAVFKLPPEILREENELKLKVFADYEVGYLGDGIMIANNDFTNQLLTYANLMKKIFSLNMGLLLLAALLLIFIYTLSANVGKAYILYALAAIFLAINIIDFLAIYDLLISRLLFKKIVVLATYIAMFFYALACYFQFKRKSNLWAGIVLLLAVIYAGLFKNNITEFMSYITILLIIGIFNVIFYFRTILKEYKNSYEAKILLLANIAIIFDVLDFFIDLNVSYSIISFSFSFIVIPISLVLLVVYNYGEIQAKKVLEEDKAKMMYQLSVTDTMTKTYNHQYIIEEIVGSKQEFVILMFDLDDFKEVNDTFGHTVGDEVIIELAKRLKNNLEQADIVGRYGGDEFIVILKQIDFKKAIAIAKELKEKIEQPYELKNDKSLELSVSIGVYHSKVEESGKEALKRVDDALYKSKKEGKGKISVYN